MQPGGAWGCVAPALIPQKLAGGFAVALDCRGVSAPAEVSLVLPSWLFCGICSAQFGLMT
jgi:chaperone required for assembly of F1-ATPase